MLMQQYDEVRQQLHEKWQLLKTIPSDEQSFLKMESVFYDILTLARLQKSSLIKQTFLLQLKNIKEDKFELTQKVYHKARQRELFICQFKTALTRDLAAYLKAAKANSNTERTLQPA